MVLSRMRPCIGLPWCQDELRGNRACTGGTDGSNERSASGQPTRRLVGVVGWMMGDDAGSHA